MIDEYLFKIEIIRNFISQMRSFIVYEKAQKLETDLTVCMCVSYFNVRMYIGYFCYRHGSR